MLSCQRYLAGLSTDRVPWLHQPCLIPRPIPWFLRLFFSSFFGMVTGRWRKAVTSSLVVWFWWCVFFCRGCGYNLVWLSVFWWLDTHCFRKGQGTSMVTEWWLFGKDLTTINGASEGYWSSGRRNWWKVMVCGKDHWIRPLVFYDRKVMRR